MHLGSGCQLRGNVESTHREARKPGTVLHAKLQDDEQIAAEQARLRQGAATECRFDSHQLTLAEGEYGWGDTNIPGEVFPRRTLKPLWGKGFDWWYGRGGVGFVLLLNGWLCGGLSRVRLSGGDAGRENSEGDRGPQPAPRGQCALHVVPISKDVPAPLQLVPNCLVPEVPHSGQKHCQPEPIRGFNYFLIPHRAAGLNDRGSSS